MSIPTEKLYQTGLTNFNVLDKTILGQNRICIFSLIIFYLFNYHVPLKLIGTRFLPHVKNQGVKTPQRKICNISEV